MHTRLTVATLDQVYTHATLSPHSKPDDDQGNPAKRRFSIKSWSKKTCLVDFGQMCQHIFSTIGQREHNGKQNAQQSIFSMKQHKTQLKGHKTAAGLASCALAVAMAIGQSAMGGILAGKPQVNQDRRATHGDPCRCALVHFQLWCEHGGVEQTRLGCASPDE